MDVYVRPDRRYGGFRAHTDLCAMVAWSDTAEGARDVLLADLKRVGFDMDGMIVNSDQPKGQSGRYVWTYRRRADET